MEVEERYLAMEWSDPHWVFTLILTALLIVGRIGFHKLNERHDNPVATIQVARTSTQIARGRRRGRGEALRLRLSSCPSTGSLRSAGRFLACC